MTRGGEPGSCPVGVEIIEVGLVCGAFGGCFRDAGVDGFADGATLSAFSKLLLVAPLTLSCPSDVLGLRSGPLLVKDAWRSP